VSGTTDTGNHTDDGTTAITLPFVFNYYGLSFSTLNASSNGNLQFLSNDTEYLNGCLPASTFNYPVLPYWDDLNTDDTENTCTPGPCGIYTTVEGSVGNRILDIEWRAVYFRAITETVNFEVRLYENPGPGNVSKLDFVYGVDPEGGNSATVGVQRKNGASNYYVQYECLQAGSISPGLQITFTLPDCATPTPVATATQPPSGTIHGHLTWDGISQPNAANNGITATLMLCNGSSQVYSGLIATDSSGNFTVATGLADGSYTWKIKNIMSLRNAGSLTISGGSSTQDFGLMKAGDADNTNNVNAVDFSILKNTFGKARGAPGYDERANFNRDNVVNAVDFNLLKSRFGQAGSAATCP